MGKFFGFAGLLTALAVGGYLYLQQTQSLTQSGSTPKTTIDVTAVHNDLIAMANAERRYWASNARYASLDELRADGVPIPNRANYSYSAEVSENTFSIAATYSGPDAEAPKRITIDQTMDVKTAR